MRWVRSGRVLSRQYLGKSSRVWTGKRMNSRHRTQRDYQERQNDMGREQDLRHTPGGLLKRLVEMR
jgi:hypothetical protein